MIILPAVSGAIVVVSSTVALTRVRIVVCVPLPTTTVGTATIPETTVPGSVTTTFVPTVVTSPITEGTITVTEGKTTTPGGPISTSGTPPVSPHTPGTTFPTIEWTTPVMEGCSDNSKVTVLTEKELKPTPSGSNRVWTAVLPDVGGVKPSDYEIMEIVINGVGPLTTVTVEIVNPDTGYSPGPYSSSPIQFLPTVSGTQIILTFKTPVIVTTLEVSVCTPAGTTVAAKTTTPFEVGTTPVGVVTTTRVGETTTPVGETTAITRQVGS